MRCDLQIFSGCVCHLEQLHAQSPFLFPIVFSINNYLLITLIRFCTISLRWLTTIWCFGVTTLLRIPVSCGVVGYEKIEIWRLKKLPFEVNCSPFILNAVIRHHLRQEEDACTSESVRQIIRTLLESFYVDDCLTSLPSTKDADVFKETSIALMANAGMELRKWRGNSIASNDNTADKALGICWELPSDKLHLPSSSVDLPTQWTRCSLLRTVAALFDPLGLMSPVTITGRILLQCSWKEKQDWDAPLSSE